MMYRQARRTAEFAKALSRGWSDYLVWRLRRRLGLDPIGFRPNTDFGNLVSKGAQEIRVARTTEDVQRALEDAKRRGITVNVCGGAHSMNGQTLSDGGIRLRLDFGSEIELEAHGSNPNVRVGGSTPWSELSSLSEHGRSVPVLTTHGSTTVGGTLSATGMGVRSIRYGRQIDCVERLEVILPSGEVVWCSPDDDRELFRHTLSGFGSMGIIRSAVLKTIDECPHLVIVSFLYRDHDACFANLAALSELDVAQVAPNLRSFWMIRPGTEHMLFYGFEFSNRQEALRYAESLPTFLQPHHRYHLDTEVTTVAQQSEGHRNVLDVQICGKWGLSKTPTTVPFWNEFVFPTLKSKETFVKEFGTRVKAARLGKYYWGSYGLWMKNLPDSPHYPMSVYANSVQSNESYHYGYGLYYQVHQDDTAGMGAVMTFLGECQDRVYELGGRLYKHAWHDWSHETLANRYGEDWQSFIALKQILDPEGVLNPDVFGVPMKNP